MTHNVENSTPEQIFAYIDQLNPSSEDEQTIEMPEDHLKFQKTAQTLFDSFNNLTGINFDDNFFEEQNIKMVLENETLTTLMLSALNRLLKQKYSEFKEKYSIQELPEYPENMLKKIEELKHNSDRELLEQLKTIEEFYEKIKEKVLKHLNKVILRKVLNTGDFSITFEGAHKIVSFSNKTIVYEFKTGPYEGKKKRFKIFIINNNLDF